MATKKKATVTKTASPKATATKTEKAPARASTRTDRDAVRAARSLKGEELKKFIAEHRESIQTVAAETRRNKLSAEAAKLLGAKD